MRKKIIALFGVLLCFIGALIYFLDTKNNNIIPNYLKGTGLWIMIFGSSFSLLYSFLERNKK